MRELHGENLETEIFLIVGADTASRIHTWHQHEEVLALSTLVVVNRPDSVLQLDPTVSADRVRLVSMPAIDVSSTEIRFLVSSGDAIDHLTTDEVRNVISARGLYRGVSA